ncbi:MAG: UDP-glucose dehydrogenase family protein [Phycisphaerae bacterium]
MRVTVAGSGYVGLVSAACLSDTGNTVIGYDIDAKKVEMLNRGHCPIFEPGLSEMLAANLKAGRLRFTTDVDDALAGPEVVFIAIGTPPQPDGSADLSMIFDFAGLMAKRLKQPTILATKSTVPVGTGDKLESLIRSKTQIQVEVASNPEFLKEGSAVSDFLRPDRVVIGAESEHAAQIIRELHLPFVRNNRPILIMRRRASEMTKYAANAFLATRISFINEIANLCDACGVDVAEVRQGIGTDSRIGFQFLYPGSGYGGSCFPKDVRALAHVARQNDATPDILDAVHGVNEKQKRVIFSKIIRRFGDAVGGMTFAIWGVTFKPGTDDLREAPALNLIDDLLEAGAKVRAHDPVGLENLKNLYGDRVAYFDNAYQALDGADALAVCTEWNEFRSPEFSRIREMLGEPVIFDGRNLYDLTAMQRYKLEYHPIGRPPVTLDD